MSPRIGAGRVSRDSSRATGQGHERCGAGRRRGGCARAWALGASSPPPASGAARRASSMWSFPSRARSLSSSSGANSAQRSITNLHIKIKSNQISYCSPPHHHPAGSASGRCSSRRTGHACSTPGTGHACSTPGALKVVTKVQQSGHKGSTRAPTTGRRGPRARAPSREEHAPRTPRARKDAGGCQRGVGRAARLALPGEAPRGRWPHVCLVDEHSARTRRVRLVRGEGRGVSD